VLRRAENTQTVRCGDRDGLLSDIKASIAWRTSVGGGGGGQAPQPEGARAARGLDARIRLQHTFMPVGDASPKTAQINQIPIDSDHGIYRDSR
jgi:hypothetical protein